MRLKTKAAETKTAREQLADEIARRERVKIEAITQFWAAELPDEKLEALQVAAHVELALEFTRENLEQAVAERRASAAKLVEQADVMSDRGLELAVEPGRVEALHEQAKAAESMAAELSGEVANAIVRGEPDTHVARIERIRDEKWAEVASLIGEHDRVRTQADESVRLDADAQAMRAHAEELRAEAADLEDRIEAELRRAAPMVAMQTRDKVKKARELLRNNPRTTLGLDSASALFDGVSIDTADGVVTGVGGLIKP